MFQNYLFTLAQAAAPSASPASGFSAGNLVPIACIFVIFYFMLIRPQSQRAKQQDALVKSVKTGDKVITAAGIHGLVANVKDTTVILKIADNVKIEVEKSAIGTVKKSEDEPAAAVS